MGGDLPSVRKIGETYFISTPKGTIYLGKVIKFEDFANRLNRLYLYPCDFQQIIKEELLPPDSLLILAVYLNLYKELNKNKKKDEIFISQLNELNKLILQYYPTVQLIWLCQEHSSDDLDYAKNLILFQISKKAPLYDYELGNLLLILRILVEKANEDDTQIPNTMLKVLKSSWGYVLASRIFSFKMLEELVIRVLQRYKSIISPEKEYFFKRWLQRRYILSHRSWFEGIESFFRPLFGAALGGFLYLSGLLFTDVTSGLPGLLQKLSLNSCYILLFASFVLTLLAAHIDLKEKFPVKLNLFRDDSLTEHLGKMEYVKRILQVTCVMMLSSLSVAVILVLFISLSLKLESISIPLDFEDISIKFLIFTVSFIHLGSLLSQLLWEDKAFIEQLSSPD